MRTRKSIRPTKEPENYRHYDFTTRSNSNGKMEYIEYDKPNIVKPGVNLKFRIKAVKPYWAALADGFIFDDGINPDSGLPFNGSPTNSDLLYLLGEGPAYDFFESLDSKFSSQKAVNGAILNAQNYGNLLMLVSAKEAKLTASMITGVFVRFYEFFFRLYKSIKHLQPYEAYKYLSDVWLEYRYGWTPLAYELKALYEHLTAIGLYDVKSSYGTVKHENLEEKFTCTLNVPLNGSYKEQLFDITVREMTHKAGFNYVNSLDSRNVKSLETLGLSIDSLFSTAWELIPFSFIIDMFLNVGDAFKSLDFHLNVKPINGYETTRYIVDLVAREENKSRLSNKYKDYLFYEPANPSDFSPSAMEALNKRRYDYYRVQSERIALTDYEELLETRVFYVSQQLILESEAYLASNPDYLGNDRFHGLLNTTKYNYERDKRLLGRGAHIYELNRILVDRNYERPYGTFKVVEKIDLEAFLAHNEILQLDRPAHAIKVRDYVLDRFSDNLDGLEYHPGRPGVHVTIERHLIDRGFFPFDVKIEMDRMLTKVLSVQIRPIDNRVYYVFPPYKSREKQFNHPFISQNLSFSGVLNRRKKRDKFDFELVADLDLSKSQIADLAIFGERMISAMKK